MRRTSGGRCATSSRTRSTTSPRPPSFRPPGTTRSGRRPPRSARCRPCWTAFAGSGPEARFVNAASAEIFGAPSEVPQREATPVAPLTPYGAGKAFAHSLTGAFRRRYGIHASSAILFNHESPRRPEQFLTRKVTRGAAAISLGLEDELRLGDLSARRDWGFAGDYVRALWLMASQEEPDDYVIATGESHSVEEFVAAAFDEVGLDWRQHVRFDESFARGAADSPELVGDPAKARDRLGWQAETGFDELVRMMVMADLELLKDQAASPR